MVFLIDRGECVMKKLYHVIVCFILLTCPIWATEIGLDKPLGHFEESPIYLDLDDYTIETYKALDNYYVPIKQLNCRGYSVSYDPVKGSVTLATSPTYVSTTPSAITSLAAHDFTLYGHDVFIGDFRTHSLISEGRILIPLGALEELFTIEGNNHLYKLVAKEPLAVCASKDSVQNNTNAILNVSVTDLYLADSLISKTSEYTLLPYQYTKRLSDSDVASSFYLSTVITAATGENLSYTDESLHGQLNDRLFKNYTVLKEQAKQQVLSSDYGDPLTLAEVSLAEATVNAQNLHSPTPYLVWTNIEKQKTYIFTGTTNNWKLLKHFVCSTGRAPTPTPKGTFHLTQKVPYFGVEKGYRCKNAFGFIGTSYLYHSLIFDKTGNYLLEGKGVLGSPASQGCIRFSVENSEWFYNTMLGQTTVWIN